MEHLMEKDAVTLVQAPLADGQTDPDSSRVDMQGWDGVVFVLITGTITGVGTCKMTVKQAATDIVGDELTDCNVTATAAADSDSLFAVDILRPIDRYLGVTLTRATENSVVGGVVAIRCRGRSAPITQSDVDTLVTKVTPAEA